MEHIPNSKHRCSFCNVFYSSNQELFEHELSLMHHTRVEQITGSTRHPCGVCSNVETSSLAAYGQHISTPNHIEAVATSTSSKAAARDRNQPGRRADSRRPKHNRKPAWDEGARFSRWNNGQSSDSSYGQWSGPGPGCHSSSSCNESFKSWRHSQESTHCGMQQCAPPWNQQWSFGSQASSADRAFPSLGPRGSKQAIFHSQSQVRQNGNAPQLQHQRWLGNSRQLLNQSSQSPALGRDLRPSVFKSTSAPPKKWSIDHKADEVQKACRKVDRSASVDSNTPNDSEPRNSLQAKLSLKASKIIDDVLKGGTGKNLALEESQTADRGAQLIKEAQNLCKELREKRHRAALAKETAEQRRKRLEHEGLRKQIEAMSEKSKSRVRGLLDNTSFSVSSSISSNSVLSRTRPHELSKPQPHSVTKKAPLTHKPAESVRDLGCPKENARCPMDRTSLMKLVNSPRSRKERMMVSKILKRHNRIQKHPARPKLQSQLSGEDRSSDTDPEQPDLEFCELPQNVQDQVAHLLEGNSAELSNDEFAAELGFDISDLFGASLTELESSAHKPSTVGLLEAALMREQQDFTQTLLDRPRKSSTPEVGCSRHVIETTRNASQISFLDLPAEASTLELDSEREGLNSVLTDTILEVCQSVKSISSLQVDAAPDSAKSLPGESQMEQETTESQQQALEQEGPARSASQAVTSIEEVQEVAPSSPRTSAVKCPSGRDDAEQQPLQVVDDAVEPAKDEEKENTSTECSALPLSGKCRHGAPPEENGFDVAAKSLPGGSQVEQVTTESQQQDLELEGPARFASQAVTSIEEVQEVAPSSLRTSAVEAPAGRDDAEQQPLQVVDDAMEPGEDKEKENTSTECSALPLSGKRRHGAPPEETQALVEAETSQVSIQEDESEQVAKKAKVDGSECGTTDSEQNTVSRVLQLSLQEEAVRVKLEQTVATIEQLMKVRQQLLKEEARLRTERLQLLKGAAGLLDTLSNANTDSCNQSLLSPFVNMMREINLNLTEADVNLNQSESALTISNQTKSTDRNFNQAELGHVNCNQTKSAPVGLSQAESAPFSLKQTESTVGGTSAQERRTETAGTTKTPTSSIPHTWKFGTRKKSASFSAPGTPAEIPVPRERTASGGATSSVNVQYVGTIAVEGGKDFVKQLAVNLAEMKKEPYVFVNESGFEDSEVEPEIQDQPTELPTEDSSKMEPTAEEAVYWTVRNDFSLQKSTKPVVLDGDGRVTNGHNPGFSGPIPSAASPKVKKPSQFYPDPGSSVQQVRKSRRHRDQNCLRSVSCPLDSSSESATTGEQDHVERPRRGKRPTCPMAKVVQEYLHASSSSDVELPGLDGKVCVAPQNPKAFGTVARDAFLYTAMEAPKPPPSDRNWKREQEIVDDTTVDDTSMDAPFELHSRGVQRLQQKSFSHKHHGPKQQTKTGQVQERTTLHAHDGPVSCQMLWEEKHLITGGQDGLIKYFQLKSAEGARPAGMMLKYEWSIHTAAVTGLFVYDDLSGLKLLSCGLDGLLVKHQFKTSANHPKRISDITKAFPHPLTCFHTNDIKTLSTSILYIGTAEGAVLCLDPQTMSIGETYRCSDTAISCICTTKEGGRSLLCVASDDCLITIRDAKTGLLLRTLQGHTKAPLCLRVQGPVLYSGGADMALQAHELNTGELLKHTAMPAGVTALQLAGANFMAVAMLNGRINIMQLRSSTEKIIPSLKLDTILFGARNEAVTSLMMSTEHVLAGNAAGEIAIISASRPHQWYCKFGSCGLRFGLHYDVVAHLMEDHMGPHFSADSEVKCLWPGCHDFVRPKTEPEWTEMHFCKHVTISGMDKAPDMSTL